MSDGMIHAMPVKQIGTLRAAKSATCRFCGDGDVDMAFSDHDDNFVCHQRCFVTAYRDIRISDEQSG